MKGFETKFRFKKIKFTPFYLKNMENTKKSLPRMGKLEFIHVK